MKETTARVLKIVALVVAIAIIVSSIFIIRSCSPAPEYEEIRARVEELIEASHGVNEIVWGKGLPTYKRVYSPKREFHESGKTYVDDNGTEQPLNYYYYYLSDGRIIAFRKQKALKDDFRYAYVSSEPMDAVALKAFYPVPEGKAATDDLYTEIYSSAKDGIYLYLVPFVEEVYDFYYTDSDPEDYDYVVSDSEYGSVDAIKEYIRTVYSEDYARSLESILFDGVAEGGFIQQPRYTAIEGSRGSLFASLNTYEPLFTEKRVYMLDTAKIDSGNSNSDTVVIEFSTYLPSKPDDILTSKLTFVRDGSTWYLASTSF